MANGLPTSSGKSRSKNEKLAGVGIISPGQEHIHASPLRVTPCNPTKTSCGKYHPKPHFTDWEIKARRD